MVLERPLYLESDLDGQEPGGFVVVNVDSPTRNPYQVLEYDENGGYFRTLPEAREACERFREEGDNNEIHIYALIGVREALALHPDAFELARA